MHALVWIVLLAPLVSAGIIAAMGGRNRNVCAMISVGAVTVSFLAALPLVFGGFAGNVPGYVWVAVPGLTIQIGATIDDLSKMMLFVVTFIGLLVHIYSLGYMKEDSGKGRYFAGLSLFMFSMLGIVIADNFLMMFIFWELVGVSSYLLIGHWFLKAAPPAAANKAFLANKIGDFGFMLGIIMLWAATGTVVFDELEVGMAKLTLHPLYVTIAAILVFCGTVGKSAQVPLHVWLPDAMEGPTPVSALIHAATMVAAGVYMLARASFVFQASATAMSVIAWVGGITALFAAIIAIQQDDIKRILAYSTLSQLGYMVMSVGLYDHDGAVFHLYTHAFFKALLFLGAGSVIVGMHHEQGIWAMGGLKNKMLATCGAFAMGSAALMGFPGSSGFWSKDAILANAYMQNRPLFWIGLIAAIFTAFYVTRLFLTVFIAPPKSEYARTQAHESPAVMTIPLFILGFFAIFSAYGFVAGPLHAPMPHHHDEAKIVPFLAIGAFLLGTVISALLYFKAKKDPIRIPLLENKFYIDEFYTVLIRYTQDLAARVAGAVDRWVIDGIFVKGIGGLVWGAGYVVRCLQVGNLQAYSFFFGAGVALVIYFVLFN